MDSENLEQEKPILMYLGDLVHNYIGKGPFMFPINIGYLVTFVKAHMHKNKKIVFRLFKYPEKLLTEIENNPPDFVGLSNYTWNANLNDKVLKFIKSKSKNIITIMGGPNIHYYQEALNEYFNERKDFLDFYVIYQGEIGFLNLLLRYIFVFEKTNLWYENRVDNLPTQEEIDNIKIENFIFEKSIKNKGE